MSTLIWVIVAFVFVFIANSVKIIRQYEKGLVETLGKYTGTRNSGANIIIPMFQKMLRVDMRERVIDVPLSIETGAPFYKTDIH